MFEFCYSRLYLGIENVSVARDGKDRHGLKLEKVRPPFWNVNAITV